MDELIVSSPAFEPGGRIPDRYSGYGEDISPEIRIDGLSDAAVSLLIILDDLSHPIHPGYNHWVAWNLPPVAVVPEGMSKGAVCRQPIYAEQGLAYGRHCYRGPKPPFHWDHEYRFTICALDARLALSADSDKKVVLKAAAGHILQTGTLTGKYQRRR